MTVAEFIKILERYPQNIKVAFELFSEQCLLEPDRIKLVDACKPRPDGWIQDFRPDMESETYLMLPGN